jgi:putative glycosyltransferase (TIGR04372 family)
VIPNFVRKKFAGVQQPLGRWILRHICEFIVLSPAILVAWIWLKVHRKEILIVGRFSSSITAFLMPLDPELRRRSKTLGELEKLIVLNFSPDANSQIRIMYNRVVRIVGAEKPLLRRVFWWCSFATPGVQEREILECQNDPHWHHSDPVVALTAEEISRGEILLREAGFDLNQEFVCYATRTDSYYQKLREVGVNAKSRSVRNPNESNYLNVSKSLSTDGLKIVRMGKDLDSNIDSSEHPWVFDYASTCRSDFIDVALFSRCKFLINGATGSVLLRAIFNLPTVNSDTYRIHKNWFSGDVATFQKVRFVADGRLATVSEMVKMSDAFSDERHQEKLGVELVKNTAEEILAACEEMIARLNGTWESTEEDEILQTRYWDLICKSGHNGGRIGAKFLRDNQDLLR